MSPRTSAAMFSAAMVAMLTALFLGEYEFQGTLPYGAGAGVGLVMGEIAVWIRRRRSFVVGLTCAVMGAACLIGAGAIDANGVEPIKSGAYIGAGIAAALSFAIAGSFRRVPRRTG